MEGSCSISVLDDPLKVLFRTEAAVGGGTKICINDNAGERQIQLWANPSGSAAIAVARETTEGRSRSAGHFHQDRVAQA